MFILFIRTSYHISWCSWPGRVPPATGHWSQECPGRTGSPGHWWLVTNNWSPPHHRPVHLAWPPPHACTRAKNGKMLAQPRISRSLNESLLLLRSILFVPSTCSHYSAASPDCQWMVLGNALSLCLTRCGPYDTRYHSRQTHTKWHNINFHREPALAPARLNPSLSTCQCQPIGCGNGFFVDILKL